MIADDLTRLIGQTIEAEGWLTGFDDEECAILAGAITAAGWCPRSPLEALADEWQREDEENLRLRKVDRAAELRAALRGDGE